jgi:hypothetical protein
VATHVLSPALQPLDRERAGSAGSLVASIASTSCFHQADVVAKEQQIEPRCATILALDVRPQG